MLHTEYVFEAQAPECQLVQFEAPRAWGPALSANRNRAFLCSYVLPNCIGYHLTGPKLYGI